MSPRFILLPLCALAFAGCNSPAPPTTTTTETTTTDSSAPATVTTTQTTVASRPEDATGAFVRGIHVVPGAGPIELRDGDTSLVKDVTFGNASAFVEEKLQDPKSTKLKISAFGEGNTKVSGPMPVTVNGGEDLSVVVNGVPGDIEMLPFKHKNHGSAPGKAKVAFLHAAKGLPGVDITIDGKSFRKNVKYGVATDYETFAPGRHEMKVDYTETTSAEKVPTPIPQPGTAPMPEVMVKQRQKVTLTQDMDLVEGQVYSITVYYDEKHLPRLTLAQDKFVPTLKNAPEK